MPPFVIKDAKFLLLTYAQVPEHESRELPWTLLSLCTAKEAECIIGRELHADGGIHFHAFVDFGGRKYSTRDTRAWDIQGRHPNIERVGRTPAKAWDYATKEGDIICGGAERPPTSEEGTSSSGNWEFILSSETRDEFFDRLHEYQPRTLACSFPSLVKYADWKYRPVPESYSHPEDWTFDLHGYPELLEWRDDNLFAKPGKHPPPLRPPQPEGRGGFPGGFAHPLALRDSR